MKIAPVSLVIPTFNRAELISETLNSAIDQSLKFQEIIVVDDGSSDSTCQVLEKYNNTIKYIKTENQGVQAARNIGIAASNSELVVLCDSDDLLESNYLEKTAPWMITNTECDILYTNFATFTECELHSDKLAQCPFDFLQGAKINNLIATYIPELYKRSIEYQPLFTCGMMLRKSFVNRIGAYDKNFKGVGAEDWEFTLRAISLGNVALCSIPLARVRKHAGNDSRNVLHMALGEVAILEHALTHHSAAKLYVSEINKSIKDRRKMAFDAAFAKGNFQIAKDISTKLDIQVKPNTRTVSYLLKKAIICMPKFPKEIIWRMTQKSGQAEDVK